MNFPLSIRVSLSVSHVIVQETINKQCMAIVNFQRIFLYRSIGKNCRLTVG